MPSDVLITPATSKIDFTDGANSTKKLSISGTAFSFNSNLNVLSSTSLSSAFKAEGVNGTLFEVTDDLSNSLMSVNTIGGLPVFEVFANNSIIGGQYGANDFVISGNKIGLGYANPVNKLSVSGSVSIGSSYNVAAPSNGLIVQGSVGIGITNPTAKLDVAGGGLSVSGWSNNNSGSTGGVEIGWDGTQGIFQVYDRVNNNYEPILINGSAIQFFISGGLKWTLTTAGVLQSNNAQTIQTSTGNLTLATAAGDGHVLLSPHNNGNVGIGTASPGQKLEVNGRGLFTGSTVASAGSLQVTAADAALRLKWTSSPVADKNTWDIRSVGTGATPYLQFRTINDANTVFTNRVAFTNDGDVGIGTEAPAGKLHVYNGSSHFEATSTGAAVISSGLYALQIGPLHDRLTTAGSYYGGIAFNHLLNFNGYPNYNNAPQAWIGTRLQDNAGSERDYLVFATKSGSGTSGAGTDIPVERMCIDRDGLVGIGTLTPSEKLEVVGVIKGTSFAGLGTNLTGTASGLSIGGTATTANSLNVANNYTVANLTATNLISNFIVPNSGITGADLYAQDVILSAYHHGDSLRYDAFQFNAPNTFETRATVGSSFVSASLDTSLFKGDRFGGALNIIYGTYQVRWTWNDVGYRYFNLLYLAYSATGHNFTVLVEKSADGVTWTTQYTSAAMAGWPGHGWYTTNWHNNGLTRLRITLTPTWDVIYSVYNISIYNMRYFCSYPLDGSSRLYDWDYSKNITFTGNVGIGITPPTAKLDVTGSATSGYSLLLRSGDTYNQTDSVQIAFGYANTTNYRHSIRTRHNPLAAATTGGIVGNNIDFYVWKRGTDAAADLGTQFVMTMQGDGNVGIGITNPADKLHVVGNAEVGDSTADTGLIIRSGAGSSQYGRIRFYSTSTNTSTIHSFPAAWQGGTFLNSSAGALNLGSTNGITFGSWNNVDVAFAQGGNIYFKGNVGIGITAPSAALHVNSTASGATLLRADGTNGTLFSVVDDLSDSLMSVNNSAGLPVLEVFADDRVVAGQYGANDFVLINNKLGLGTNSPAYKLDVRGSTVNARVGLMEFGSWPLGSTYIYLQNNTLSSIEGNYGFLQGPTGETFVNAASGQTLHFRIGNSEKWAVLSTGVLQSDGLQTIRTSTGTLTLATALGNGHIILSPHGTGNVGIGTITPSYKLHVTGDIYANGGWLRVSGTSGLYFESYGGGWYMDDATWVRTHNAKSVWTSTGLLGSNGGLTVGYGGSSPTSLGAIIAGSVGIGTYSPGHKLEVVSTTANNGSPFAGCFFSGDDSSAMWRCAVNLQHNANTTIATGSSVGLSFAPLSSTSSNFYGSAAIKAVRPNTTANNQDTDLAFWTRTGASNNTVDTEKLRIKGNGNVGIGTTSPTALLNTAVTGQIQIGTSNWPTSFVGKSGARTLIGNDAVLILWNDTSTIGANVEASLFLGARGSGSNGATSIAGGGIRGLSEDASTNKGYLKFETNGGSGFAEAMRIKSDGNVGIGTVGTTGPSNKLHVWAGTIQVSGFPSIAAGPITFLRSDYNGSAAVQINFLNFNPSNGYDSDLGIQLMNTSGSMVDVLRIKGSTGNVGIGKTTPNAKLNVLSTSSLSSVFKTEGVNGTLFEVTDDLSNSLMSVNTIGGLPVFEVFANNSIIAGQYGQNDFVISGNKVGIGTASPIYKLDVYGSSSSDVGRFYNNSASCNFYIGSTNNTAATALVFYTSNGNGQIFKNRSSTGWGGADSFNIYSSNGAIAFHPAGTTNALYIANNGNVSLGSSTATTLLQIGTGTPTADTGGIQFGGDTTARIYRVGAGNIQISNNLTVGGTVTGTFAGNITGNVTGNASGSSASAGYLTGGEGNFYGILYNNTSGNLNLYDTPGLISAEYVGTTNNPTGSQSNGHFIQISDAGGTDVKTQWYYQSGGIDISMRLMWGNGSWLPWRKLLHNGNYNSYALPLTGGTLTGTITATNFIGPINGDSYNNLSNNYKDIYVYGDANTYYIVFIQGEYSFSFGRYSVTRGYSWSGPNTWNTASHKGGLTLDWEWSGDVAWGGNDHAIRIIEFNETYSTMVAGLGYPVTGGVIIWLRGGGALYRIRTPIGANSTVTIYDGDSAANHVASTTYTAANSAVFSSRADVSNVSAEILARYPVRDTGSLYVNNNAVLHAGNTVLVANGGTGVTTATANNLFAAPADGSSGAPSFRAMVSADIPSAAVTYAKMQNGAALSVIGVSGNSVAVPAAITGAGNQVLRVNDAGTFLAFGAINLASAYAVTGILPIANGGTGTTTGGGGSGTVTSVVTGDGLSGGPINTTGTITVDASVVRTTGTQTIGGTKTFSSTISGSINGSASTLASMLITQFTGTLAVTNGGTGATSFTAGRVLLGNGTTDITTSANLFYNTSTNRLGVGTTTPGYTLDVGGACHASSFPTSSDIRFKKNIQPLKNALQTILSLRGVKYEWNNFIHSERPGYELNTPIIGMIAQEVEQVIPEIVGKWMLNENFQDARSLEYQRIIPYLIEAVKELNNKNKLLESRLLILENK